MDKITSLERFRCPFGGQDVELQQLEYAAGGMPLLRLRIRERTRFTIFEIDPATAARWGQAMLDWSLSQTAETGAANP
ncbi:MAG: hypothetical protein WBP72_03855 [Rhodocyclaceae bacterium]